MNLDINKEVSCLVIGSGEMGQAHIDVVKAQLGDQCAVFARTDKNKAKIERKNISFFAGDLNKTLSEFLPSHVIIAAPVEKLSELAIQVIKSGVKNILIEKPAVLTTIEGENLINIAKSNNVKIWVAYNRRFYSSVRTAMRMIKDSNEKIENVLFEFTEWSHIIEGLDNQSQEALENWVLSNSMHVIDGALHPVGMPDIKKSFFTSSGSLDWHPSASIFNGAGKTVKGIPYSYSANWSSPGRWWFEWVTSSTRYIFRPMEQLHVTKKGSVSIDEIELDDNLDIDFKPGVYMQDQQFFLGNKTGLMVPLSEAVKLVKISQMIGNYPIR
jgi:predicted dehydrogenase